jgi:multicomponent Na+:H+ antiporter subunit D
MSFIASMFMLLGIAMTLILAGDISYAGIKSFLLTSNSSHQFQIITVLMLFITGLSIKAGLAPFHGWLPAAYSNSPSAVSVLLAGIVTKVAGVYSIYILLVNIFDKNATLSKIIMLLGIISIVFGAIAAIAQNNFKKILAFSSISQVGYIIFAIGVGTPLALLGAFFHFFNHATFKSLFFVNSAAIKEQTGTTSISDLGGLASKMKITGGTSVVGFLSAAGIPPLAGFWSKLIIIIASWQAGMYLYTAIALFASIITITYFLRMQRKVFFGELKAGLEGVVEANRGICFAYFQRNVKC